MFHNYFIKGLDTKEEINSFIELQLKEEKEISEKIINSLELNESRYINSFLCNPLLLSLYILTFQSNATIPDKKYIFYRRVINALFSEHDSKTKLGFVRERLSGINQEDLEKILRAFCYISFFDNQFSFDFDYVDEKFSKIKEKFRIGNFENTKIINDLKSAISLWVDDNGIYSFAHRSIQEYFAASFIKNLNECDKERIYGKIISKFSDKKASFNEIENFLSLLEEIDQFFFYKYYKLPLFKELYELMNCDCNDDMIKSFILFLCNGIRNLKSNKNRGPLIEVNKIVYRSIYIHLPYTQTLHSSLSRIIRNNYSLLFDNNFDMIKFDCGIPDELFEKFNSYEILTIATDFKSFIENNIKEIECYVTNSISNDREFVDMI